MANAKLTPSQTVGPFYWGTLVTAYRCDLAPPGVPGERIEVVLSLHDVQDSRELRVDEVINRKVKDESKNFQVFELGGACGRDERVRLHARDGGVG